MGNKVVAILNPENGTCKKSVLSLYNLYKKGYEIEKIILVLENTYHAEKWVLSLSMPLSKEDIEKLKKRYIKAIVSEWEALTEEKHPPIEAIVDEAKNVVDKLSDDYDLLVLGCIEHKYLCKLIEHLDKPILVVKN